MTTIDQLLLHVMNNVYTLQKLFDPHFASPWHVLFCFALVLLSGPVGLHVFASLSSLGPVRRLVWPLLRSHLPFSSLHALSTNTHTHTLIHTHTHTHPL